MKIQKLSINSYRVRMTYQGKVYSKYYKFKPSMKEVKDDLNEMIKNDESILRNDTLDNYIKTYKRLVILYGNILLTAHCGSHLSYYWNDQVSYLIACILKS